MEKDLMIILREANASALCDPIILPDGTETSLLRGWDMVENDGTTPVECTKANIVRMPPKGVKALLDFCLNAAKTVKKTGDEGEMLEPTQGGSLALVVGQTT